MARKIGGWRWKSADICEKEHARQVRSANGKLCGRRHAVKKVCEKRKLDGRGGIIPTAERLRGKNYAPEKCAAEIRQAGKRGITLSESLRHHPQHMVDGNAAMVVLRRFFIIIIYRDLFDLSGFFRSRPESPVIRAFRLVKSACFISLRRGLTNISCGGIISAQKNKCSFWHAGCTRTIVRYHRAVILTAKQNKCSINPEEVMNF